MNWIAAIVVVVVIAGAAFGAWWLSRSDTTTVADDVEARREPMADDELARQLARVTSDLRFRRWTRHRVKVVAVLIAFDLAVSCGTVIALLSIRHVQLEGCQRDNRLRAAYTAQWQPLLDDAKKDPAQNAATIQRFQTGLDGFAQHPC